MNTVFHRNTLEINDKFLTLKKSSDRQRSTALKKRMSDKPQATDVEYLYGALVEMYEPYLAGVIRSLAKKGYAIDATSGFGGKFAEFQAMTGDFSIDYVAKNKLEKLGIKFREFNGTKSLVFWPEKATMECIVEGWMKIVAALPDKGPLKEPSQSTDAIMFRRKYIPENLSSRKLRLFERMKFGTRRKVEAETKIRQKSGLRPTKTEIQLGLFIQELEPQVRQAVIEMNKKGYSTDKSGFMDNPSGQMIEGDFLLDEETKLRLEASGVIVETNPSGYTRIQFLPGEPDMDKIKRKWNKTVALLPDKNQTASVSMTRNAREFRIQYQ